MIALETLRNTNWMLFTIKWKIKLIDKKECAMDNLKPAMVMK